MIQNYSLKTSANDPTMVSNDIMELRILLDELRRQEFEDRWRHYSNNRDLVRRRESLERVVKMNGGTSTGIDSVAEIRDT
jgi:hypothetical protein